MASQSPVEITKEDFDILKRFLRGENPPQLFALLRNKFFNVRPPGSVVFHIDADGNIQVVHQQTTIRMEKLGP